MLVAGDEWCLMVPGHGVTMTGDRKSWL